MNTIGFNLNELSLRGKNVPNAQIQFDPNLTIVAGLSNTGKSYIYQCIKYLLGSKTRPKDIKQVTGYSHLLLELSSRDKGTFVLERALGKAGDFTLYQAPLTDIEHAGREVLSGTHSEKGPKNISSFLLRLSGFDSNLRLLENKNTNKTRALWFHDIRPFFLLDEVRIISELSPARPSNQYSKQTAETSTFDLMLSGQDWSNLVAKPKKFEIQVASWESQNELLQKLISPLKKSTSDAPSAVELKEASLRSENRIADAIRDLTKVGDEVAHMNCAKKSLLDKKRPKELRTHVIEQLLGQFALLATSYHSDLERLEFIEETVNLTSQLGTDVCPTCGQPLPQSEDEDHPHLSTEDQIQSARTEKQKITRHLDDLAKTIQTLNDEQAYLVNHVFEIEQQVGKLDLKIKNAWRQQLKPLNDALAIEKNSYEKITRQLNDWRQLEELQAKLHELGDKPRRRRKGEKAEISELNVSTQARRKFCDFLESTLTTWKVPNVGTVEFGSNMNLVIGGVQAISNGKGVRAIIKSAFAVSLMRYCIVNNLPHPGIVLLDSPLTSYKEADREELGEAVQQAFYTDLANSKGKGQVIILENKEPPANIQLTTNYYHFTRSHGHGRYGFFPA